MAVWLGWNYTPLCWSQVLCHFLRGPRVILPRSGWFIEWLHYNSYMVEGPITHRKPVLYSAIKGVTALMNRSLRTVCLLYNASKHMYMAFIGSGQVSNQYFSSILFSIRPSLPTLIPFTEYSWGESSFYKQSLNSWMEFVSFHSYCAHFFSFYCDQRSVWWSKAAYSNVCLSPV